MTYICGMEIMNLIFDICIVISLLAAIIGAIGLAILEWRGK